MKNLILIMAAAMLVLSSCQKENIVVETNDVSLFDKAAIVKIFHLNSPGEPYCSGTPGTCLPQADIKGEIAKAFDVITTGDEIAISFFFEKNRNDLAKSINETAIDLVIKGDLTVKAVGPNLKGETFMIFKNSNGKRKLVIPFVK